MNYKEFKQYVDKTNKNIADKLKDNEEELVFYTELVKRFNDICEEKEKLKKQLEYLRSGEYYNQLRFENKMLQDVVDNGEVSKEDKEFIDCTHRNTELLEQQQELIKYLKSINLFETVGSILKKYKEIIGIKDGK